MKLNLWLPAFIFFLLLFFGGNSRNTFAQTQKPRKEKPGKTVLVFEKKQCNGSCPVYTAEFFSDGLVKVNGINFVKKTGASEFRLYPEEICNLFTEAQTLGFFELPDRFETLITDFPTRELTLYKKNKPKKVIFAGSDPAVFDGYMKRLAAIVEQRIN